MEVIHHHTGGLEKMQIINPSLLSIHHHTGGLENIGGFKN
ncbi:hypothetical protein BAZOLSSOX_2264 [uncultured Gammaproteobacteria bacterium]|nr:hypothetical protein BAZOLSSOX_2264 [uncultured Gammaproteobacteria bacterium]